MVMMIADDEGESEMRRFGLDEHPAPVGALMDQGIRQFGDCSRSTEYAFSP
jgi:hypothetical protein